MKCGSATRDLYDMRRFPEEKPLSSKEFGIRYYFCSTTVNKNTHSRIYPMENAKVLSFTLRNERYPDAGRQCVIWCEHKFGSKEYFDARSFGAASFRQRREANSGCSIAVYIVCARSTTILPCIFMRVSFLCGTMFAFPIIASSFYVLPIVSLAQMYFVWKTTE